MKHGSTNRRSRSSGKNGGRRNGNVKTRVYDSNGPDVRIRGTCHQITEKYLNLAKDASSAGDHVLAESYLQHAEHYQRIINEWSDTVEGLFAHDGMPASQQNTRSSRRSRPVRSNMRDDEHENADSIGNLKEDTLKAKAVEPSMDSKPSPAAKSSHASLVEELSEM